MSSQYNCDYCNNLVYDEEIEGYVCDVDMDEDDYARLLSSSYKQCPYYQSNDEYKIVPVSYTHLTLPTICSV